MAFRSSGVKTGGMLSFLARPPRRALSRGPGCTHPGRANGAIVGAGALDRGGVRPVLQQHDAGHHHREGAHYHPLSFRQNIIIVMTFMITYVDALMWLSRVSIRAIKSSNRGGR